MSKKKNDSFEVYESGMALASVNLQTDVHTYLEHALEASGLTQSKLARRVGVKRARISKILSEPSNMTLDVVARLAAALDLEWALQLSPSVASRANDPNLPTHTNIVSTDGYSTHKLIALPPCTAAASTSESLLSSRCQYSAPRPFWPCPVDLVQQTRSSNTAQ